MIIAASVAESSLHLQKNRQMLFLSAMKRIFFIVLFIAGLFYNLCAQSRLVPVSRHSFSMDDYYEKCESLLLDYDREEHSSDFVFTIRPSFSPESACYYNEQDSVFVLNVADKSIYYNYNFAYSPSSIKRIVPQGKVTIIKYRCSVSPEIARHFMRLFAAAVFSSSYLARSYGLDGTTYELSVMDLYKAECWSPDEGNCYELVEILHHLSNAIKADDSSAIERMIPNVDALCHAFQELYPDDVDKNGLPFWVF